MTLTAQADTEDEEATPRTLFEVFTAAAGRHPDAPAVSDDARSLTYRELSAAALDLADRLREAGISRGDHVGVYRPRGVDAVASVLGVLASGAAYLPVDIRYPDDRRDYMLRDGMVAAIVVPPAWRGRVAGHRAATVVEWEAAQAGDRTLADAAAYAGNAGLDDVACILYTSGSTGQPKGIMLEHRNMVLWAANPALPRLGPGDRVGQVASISFDPFNYDLWFGLAGGAEIVVLPSIPDLMSGDFGRSLRRRRITSMLMPAVAINHLAVEDREALNSLRILHSGGDVLLPAACRSILESGFEGRLFNLYGPAETTTACTGYEVTGAEPELDSVPIGRALHGFDLHVLDEDGDPVPDGSPGELYVAGESVARGYLGKPELTAEKFGPNPFGPGRIYATGDTVVRRPDGVLIYQGRADKQVKIQGYRVEPAEVERLLCRHPEVHESAVLAVGSAGAHRLVAFLVAGEDLTIRELRDHLSARAPDYLVPATFIVVRELPTDPHGKRDWDALAQAAADEGARRAGYVAPSTDAEKFVAALWEDLLHVENIGVDDDFFALGGHSLVAVRARLRIADELGVELDAEDTFTESRLHDLAERIEQKRRSR